MGLLWGALFGSGARNELETCVVWEAGALARVEYLVKTYQKCAESIDWWKCSVRSDVTFIVYIVLRYSWSS